MLFKDFLQQLTNPFNFNEARKTVPIDVPFIFMETYIYSYSFVTDTSISEVNPMPQAYIDNYDKYFGKPNTKELKSGNHKLKIKYIESASVEDRTKVKDICKAIMTKMMVTDKNPQINKARSNISEFMLLNPGPENNLSTIVSVYVLLMNFLLHHINWWLNARHDVPIHEKYKYILEMLSLVDQLKELPEPLTFHYSEVVKLLERPMTEFNQQHKSKLTSVTHEGDELYSAFMTKANEYYPGLTNPFS